MNVQEVIKSFMAKLANHGYAYSDSVGENMLDSAVRASSRFSSIQAVIEAMKADQEAAEKLAVEEVLGSSYAGQTLSQVSSDILSADAKTHDGAKAVGNAFIKGFSPSANVTVENVIKERKAYIFLENYCGIQLPKRYWLTASGSYTSYADSLAGSDNIPLNSTSNDDTGAITGSDANASNPTKTDHSIVPEELINTYIASTATAQNITTNNRDWVVQATDSDDTITANGSDSINAGAGSDKITANADGATITSGTGADFITVSAGVSDITLSDLNSDDTLTISGNFEIGSAHIEDTLLVITDKTGTRKIRLGDLDNAKNAKINSTTIGDWLTNAGINLNNLTVKNYSDSVLSSNNDSSNAENANSGNADEDIGRIAIDPDYTPSPIPAEEKPSVKKGIDYSRGTPYSSSNTANGAISVDLGSVNTNEGNVIIDGATVGAVSSTFPNASTFTRNGLTIHLLGITDTSGHPDNITSTTFDSLTEDQKTIVAGLFKWWGKECLTLNEESYGIGFNSPTTMVKDIGLFFYDSSSSGTLATVWNWQRLLTDNTGDGAAIQLMLNVNMNYYNGISATDVDGTSKVSGAGLLDRTLAHEFTHAVMAANVNYFNSLPKFIKEGFAELTHGIDDERGGTIFKIAYDAEQLAGSLDLANTGTGLQTVGDGYAGGYMFLRYFAKQAAAQTENLPALGEITATVNLADLNPSLGNVLYIDTTQKNPTVQIATDWETFEKLDDVFLALGGIENAEGYPCYVIYSDVVKQVVSMSENISLADSINSNTTVNGSAGTDVVILSEGANIINAGAGDDIVDVLGQYSTINAGEGNDDINISDGSHHSINLGNGNNIVNIQNEQSYSDTITGGDGNDTVKDDDSITNYHRNYSIELGDGDNQITFDYAEVSTLKTGAGNDIISVTGGENNVVDSGDNADYVEVLGDKHSLNAGDGDDSIYVLGNANTIIGGDGNDTIYQYSNSTGGNYFVYNSTFGDDTILGFKANDSILIPDSFSTTKSGSVITISKDDTVKGHIYLNGVTSPNVVAGVVKELIKEDKTMADTIITSSSTITDFTNVEGASSTGTSYEIQAMPSGHTEFKAGSGNDTITNNASDITIKAGAGDDSITNNKANVLIEAGDGNDKISNANITGATINGGAGNDSINNNNGTNVLFIYTGGKDTINGFNSNTLKFSENISAVTVSNANNDKKVIFKIGSGGDSSITLNGLSAIPTSGQLKKTEDNYTLSGISIAINGFDSTAYVNNLSNVTINGNTSVKNMITNNGASVAINGSDKGDVIINNNGGVSATITTGAGNDTITNNATNVTISAGTGDDKITNTAQSGVLFQYTGGNDEITGFNANTLKITTTADVNTATLDANKNLVLKIGGGASLITLGSFSLAESNNKIELTLSNVQLSGGGSTTLTTFVNQAGGISIIGNTTGETITNSGANVYIGGVSGADKITNQTGGTGVTITAGKDNDTIDNQANNVSISGGSGVNEITNSGSNVTITTTDGDDKITISGGSGISVDAGAGANEITNSGSNVTITTGADKDKIINKASNVTISAGAGDDTIENESDTLTGIVFNYGGGSDTIKNFGGNTLKITTGTFSAATLDANKNLVLQIGGSSKISLGSFSLGTTNTFALSSTAIQDNSGNNKLLNVFNNSASNITITGTDAAETITNTGSSVAINALSGANFITNDTGGSNVTITTGAGNNTITNKVAGAIINAGGGSDSIISTENVTVAGGAGNDYVSIASGKILSFTYGGGSDTIVGFSASSTLKLGEGISAISDATITANDVLLKIDNDVVKLAGASSLVLGNNNIQSLKLFDSKGTEITLGTVVIVDGVSGTINGTAANETIDNKSASGVTIAAGDGSDKIINSAQSGVTFNYGGGDDTIDGFNANTLNIGSANTFKSASLDADKNLVLTVGGASKISLGSFSLATNNTFTLSSDKIVHDSTPSNVSLNVFNNSASGITISGTEANETITNTATGVKISAGGGSDVINNSASGTSVTIETGTGDDTITNKANLVTINSGSGADSIFNDGGASVVFEYLNGTTGKTTISGFNATSTLKTDTTNTISSATLNANSVVLKFGAENSENQVILAGLSALPTSGQINNGSTFDLKKITVANGATGTIKGTSGDDTITNQASDVVISMGGGSDSIDNTSGSATGVTFIYGGGSATIAGFKADSTLKVDISEGTNTIGKATLASDGSIDLGIGSNVLKLKNFVTGSVSSFTLDALSLFNKDVTTKSALSEFTNKKAEVTITGGNANDTITNEAKKVTINAGGGNNVITNSIVESGGGSEAMIISGSGADTITNKANKVTINAGLGNDSIKNDGGSNVVFIYTGGDDTIDGFQADSKFSLGAANLSIAKATIGTEDVSLSITNGGTVKLTGTSSIFNAGMSILNAAGSVVALNNFEIADGATGTINGTSGNDVVINKSKLAIISLGAGADSVDNQSGSSVTFIHGGGSDTIGGFSSSTLIIGSNSTVGKATLNGNNIDLKIGDDTVKLGSVTLGGTSFNLTNPFNIYKGSINETNKAALIDIQIDSLPTGITKITGASAATETINNKVASITIDAGGGSNFITNSGASVSISGGSGADTIFNNASYVTIAGGSGVDSISNDKNAKNVLFQYSVGDGATKIKGFNADDSLQIMTASTSISKATLNSGSTVLQIGSTSTDLITLEDYGATNNFPISVKNNAGSAITLEKIEITLGNDAHTIANSIKEASITGTSDNDTITNKVEKVSIVGNAGNDSIISKGDNVTINAGAGADNISISGESVVFLYNKTDGKDVITGFNATSTLKLSDYTNTIISGSNIAYGNGNIVITVNGSDNIITLKGAVESLKYNDFKIQNQSGSAIKFNGLKITGTNKADSIDNYFANATIDAGKGADSITNHAVSGVYIDAGTDNDVVYNMGASATNVTIVSSGGANSIKNDAANVYISLAGSGKNTIENTGASATEVSIISNSSGAHLVSNAGGASMFISLAGGADSIYNMSASATAASIYGGDGANFVSNGGALAYISLGSGADKVYNTSESATKVTILSSGNGNDLVENKGASAYISLGGGKDTIYNTANAVSILSGAGDDLISVTGASAYIDAGTGKDSIYNYDTLSTNVSIFGSGNDSNYVYNVGASAIISLGGGADKVDNSGASATKVSIYGGDGANSINNEGASAVISLGGGRDSIFNITGASFVSIFSGAEADYISNTGASASIKAEAGNDTILSTGDYVTIDGGLGDDNISISGASAVFLYNGGKDTITGFAKGAKLQLVGYSASTIGGNLLTVTDKTLQLSLGTDSIITLKDVFPNNKYDTLNIVNASGNTTIKFDGIKINGTTGTSPADSLVNYFDKATISGFAGNDTIENYGASASIDAGDGNDLVISSFKADVYIIGGKGDDTIYNYGVSAGTITGISITGGDGADYISNSLVSNAYILGDAGKDTILNLGGKAISASIYGGADNDSIKNEGASSYINLGAGTDTIFNVNANAVSIVGEGNNYVSNSIGSGLYISLGSGNDTVENLGASAIKASIFGGAGTNVIKNAGDSAVISLGTGNDIIENLYTAKSVSIYGGDGTNSVKNAGESAVISLGGGADTVENLGASATATSIFGGLGNNSIKNEGASAYIFLGKDNDSVINTITGTNVSIFAGDGANNINNSGASAAISLGSGNDYITNSGAAASIYADAGKDTISNSGGAASIFGGADNDSIVNTGAKVSIFGDAGADYINNSVGGVSAVLDGGDGKDTIINSGASATIYGGVDNDSIANENGAANVVFAYSIGGGKSDGNDTISGFNTSSTFSIVGGSSTAMYEYSSTVDSNNNVILTVYGDSTTSDITFAGAGGLSEFDIKGNISLSSVLRLTNSAPDTFKVAEQALGGNSAGKNLKVIDASARTKAIHIIGNEKANSIVGGKGADTLDGGGSAAVVDSLYGGAGNDVFIFSGGSVIIEDYNVAGKDKVSLASSIIGGYTKFDSIQDSNGNLLLQYKATPESGTEQTHNLTILGGYGQAITFTEGTTDVIRAYQDNAVFNNTTVNATAMTLESDLGGASSYDASKYSKVVTINAESVNSAIAITGNTLGNYIIAGLSGATIDGKGGNDTIVAGGSSTADYVFVYENTLAGTDTILDYNNAKMSISLGSGVTQIADVTVADSVATFKFGNNSAIAVKGVDATVSKINIVGGVSTTFSLASDKQGVFVNDATNPTAISLPATFDATYTVPGGVHTVDASKLTNAIYITGSDSATSILGSSNNDTLAGVKGNNKLTGDDGADLFIYSGGGSDTITDYDSKDDKILIQGTDYKDFAFGTGEADSVNLILTYNSGASGAKDTTLTLAKGRSNNTVTFATSDNKNSTTYIFNDHGVFDSKLTSATILSSANNFDASSYKALVTIAGTAAKQAASLFGNDDKANVIIAGASGATMDGRKGNDTLFGGKGNDVFVYANKDGGTDVIENYGGDSSSDVISLGSGVATISDVTTTNEITTFKIGNGGVAVSKPTNKNITFVGGVSAIFSIGGGVFVDNDTNPTAVSLPATFDTKYTVPGGISNVDASKATKALYITGNAEDNSILGSDGNDTLDGKGGDNTLEGGKGNDLFIFSGGSGVINDYSSKGTLGADKITIVDSLTYKDYAIGGTSSDSLDLYLIYTDGKTTPTESTLKVVGAAATTNNTVTFAKGNQTTINVFTDRGIFDVKKTMVTIASGLSSFTAEESTLVTINGSAVKQAASIIGNSGNNYIIAGDKGTTLYSGKGGNDTFKAGGGSDVIVYESGSVNYTVVDFNSNADAISLGSDVKIADVTEKNKDLTFKVDKNSIIVKGIADSVVTFKQDGGQDSIFSNGVFSIASASSVTIPASYAKNDYSLVDGVLHADASARTKLITLNGNDKANSLFGGKGNDTLNGGAGDDSLTGGAGNDLFIFNGGEDVIFDYSAKGSLGADKISIASSLASAYSDFAVSNGDLVIGYGTGNSLTIQKGDGQEISFVDKDNKTTTYIYNQYGVFDTKKTMATLASSLPSYDGSKETALLTISASAVKDTISIIGNDKANVIFAGSHSATLNGKAGNDTLYGGAGNDIFYYENSLAGNDVIVNYGSASSSDVISLGSGLTIEDVTINKTNDVVVKVGKNTITVKDAAVSVSSIKFDGADSRTLSIAGGANNKEVLFVDSSNKSVSLPATFATGYTVNGGMSHVDASALTKLITLTGDANANSLIGGKGNDTLIGLKGNDTFKGGAGNDVFVYGGGSDVIVDYSTTGINGVDKISLDTALTESGFAFINGDKDLIIGYGTGDSLTIKDGKANNSITFVEGKTTTTKIYDTAGTFDPKKTSVTLAPVVAPKFDASSISDYSGLLTIDGSAAGNITITGNDKANRIIAGGDSANSLGSTINGGKGNDTLVGSSLGADLFIFDSLTPGNDTIVEYESKDKISLGGGLAIEDVTAKDNKNKTAKDITFKVGKSSIIVKDVVASTTPTISLTSGAGDDSVYYVDSETFMKTNEDGGVSVTLPANYDTKSPYTLSANTGSTIISADASALKKAVNLVGNAKGNTLIGGKGNDTLNGDAGNDYFVGNEGADIFIYNGGADSIVSYELKDKINVSKDFTLKGYSISGSDVVLDYGSSNALSIKGAKDTAISFLYGNSKKAEIQYFNEKGVFDSKKTAFSLQGAGASSTVSFAATGTNADYAKLITIDGGSAGTTAVSIVGSSTKANRLIAGDKGSTLDGGGKTNDTLVGGAGADIFIYKDSLQGNDIIVDYGTGADLISLGSNLSIADVTQKKTKSSNNDIIFKIGKNSLTVKEAATNITLTGGVIGSGKVVYDKNNDILINENNTAVSILASYTGNSNSFTLTEPMSTVNASARTKQINLKGRSAANVIIGGAGNDTLNGAGEGNSLTGGRGNDLFVFSSGNDTITDYSPKGSLGADKIDDSAAKYSDFAISGSDVILSYEGDYSLTIAKGKGQQLSFANGNKTEIRVYDTAGVYDGKVTSMSLASGLNTAFDATTGTYSNLVTIDGSKITTQATINGNAKGNIISAGITNSTLNGKAGNDTLIGGGGEDLFIYANGEGNDVISDYGDGDGDRISLGTSATITDVTIKEDKKTNTKDLIVKVGKGTITIKDGAKSTESSIAFVGAETGNMSGSGVFTSETTMKLFPSFTGTVSGDQATIDASSVKAGIAIEGSGYVMGGNGKDILSGGGTLWGGKGNDLINASSAAQIIYHAGEGTDTITGLTLDNIDILKIYDKGTSTKEVGITKGTINKDGSLTLNVTGGGAIYLKDTAITEPNTSPYKISGTDWYVGKAKNGALTFSTTKYEESEE